MSRKKPTCGWFVYQFHLGKGAANDCPHKPIATLLVFDKHMIGICSAHFKEWTEQVKAANQPKPFHRDPEVPGLPSSFPVGSPDQPVAEERTCPYCGRPGGADHMNRAHPNLPGSQPVAEERT